MLEATFCGQNLATVACIDTIVYPCSSGCSSYAARQVRASLRQAELAVAGCSMVIAELSDPPVLSLSRTEIV